MHCKYSTSIEIKVLLWNDLLCVEWNVKPDILTLTEINKDEHKNLQMMIISAAHFGNPNLQQQATSDKYFLFIRRKTRCFKLMLILLHLSAHISLHFNISLWCRHCNKIKCHRGKNGKWILTMFVLPESKAIVTEQLTVADFQFCDQVKYALCSTDPKMNSHSEDNFHLLKYSNTTFQLTIWHLSFICFGFYRATACNATHGIAVGILSVRPSVHPSDACIVTKLNNALRIFWYHTKRQSL